MFRNILYAPDGRTIKDEDKFVHDYTFYSLEEQAKILRLKPGDVCAYFPGGYEFIIEKLIYNGTSFEKYTAKRLWQIRWGIAKHALSTAWQWVKKTLHIKDKPTKRK